MRLLFLTQDFPPDVGGTQTYAFELARRLARRCEAFTVIAPRAPGHAEADRALPFEVVRVRASYDTLSVKALGPVLGRTRRPFDAAFHVQWPTALATLPARRLGRLRRIFVAAHGRELLFNPLPAPLGAPYERLRRSVLTRADRLFPVSRYTGSLLEASGVPPERVSVLPNGADPDRFSPGDAPALRERLGVADRRVVLSVSRLVPRKGLDTVIRALPRVAEAVPEVVYLIGGAGPDRPRLEALIRETGVADRVRFLGKIPEAELPDHFRACDVFVMPSRLAPPQVEGFGLVFLEANACGKPVIGARTGGIPDAIAEGETGLLVAPDDVAGLADAMTRVLADPALAHRLGERGRTRVLEGFTWNHVADRLYEAMMRDLTASSNAAL